MSRKRVIPRETLVDLYVEKELTIKEVAKELHSSCHTIIRNLKEHDIHIKTNAEVHTKHGMFDSRPYKIWLAMKTRCSNSKQPIYEKYGAKGISYPDKWKTFEGFWEDMESDYADDKTLDRIDSTKSYSKENCRWIDYKGQNRNKSDNVLIIYDGETKTIAEWAEGMEVSQSALYNRRMRGWSDRRIIEESKPLSVNQFSKK